MPTLLIILILLIGPFIGSFLGVFKRYNKISIDKMLVFATGVMVAISIFQLVPQSIKIGGMARTLVGVVIGVVIMFVLNIAIPHFHLGDKQEKFKKTALFLFLGISIHNFPEGLAVGTSGIGGDSFSFLTALAIAIHDIPETVCVAAPLYLVLKNSQKAFGLSMLSALPTIFGFIVSYYLVKSMPTDLYTLLIGATAGIMLFVSFAEILAPIYKEKKNKSTIIVFALIGVCFAVLMQFVLNFFIR